MAVILRGGVCPDANYTRKGLGVKNPEKFSINTGYDNIGSKVRKRQENVYIFTYIFLFIFVWRFKNVERLKFHVNPYIRALS